MAPGTLHDAFVDELQDSYDAEKQLRQASFAVRFEISQHCTDGTSLWKTSLSFP